MSCKVALKVNNKTIPSFSPTGHTFRWLVYLAVYLHQRSNQINKHPKRYFPLSYAIYSTGSYRARVLFPPDLLLCLRNPNSRLYSGLKIAFAIPSIKTVANRQTYCTVAGQCRYMLDYARPNRIQNMGERVQFRNPELST